MNRSPRYTALATALALSLGIDPAATAGSLLVADADRPVHGQHAGDWQARANNLRRSSEPRVGGRANSDASVAMTRTVTSCADDGSTGTLRQVVAVAVSGDTIDLSARACTITLASAITIGVADLTIHGSGQGTLTIDGASKDRVLNHTVSGTLHVDNLAVTHGHIEAAGAADGRGGCIASYRYGGEVVLDHVKVTACSVHSAHYAYGGGVSAYAISLTNSTISGNTASGAAGARGGGALSYASTDLVDSIVSGNTATTGSTSATDRFAIGGGLSTGHDLTLTRSMLVANTATTASATTPAVFAQAWGGGASGDYGVTLDNSIVSGNIATTGNDASAKAFARGGGLYSRNFYTITLTNSTVSDNSALSGTFAVGGGFFVTGDVVSSGSTISGNISSGSAGGLASVYPITLTNSTVAGNRANGGVGGGIESIQTGARTYINNSTIAFNYVHDGGAGLFMYHGYVFNGHPLTLQSSIIASNRAGASATHAADVGADTSSTAAGANNLVRTVDPVLTLPGGTLASDPLLQPLGDYGGPTLTIALGPSSPAVAAGNNVASGLLLDQRGFPRVAGGAIDIGAFELQNPLDGDLIFRNGFN